MTRVPAAARRAARTIAGCARRAPGAFRLEGVRLGPGDVAIDCGANVGDVTAELAAGGADVHAFEPNPHAFAVLEKRVGGRPTVHLYPFAVLDRDGDVRLYMHRNAAADPVRWSTGSSVLEFKGNIDPATFVDVRAIDLARFVLDLARPVRLLKLDVEGAEPAILHRLIDSGALERIETVLVELHEAHVPELREPIEELRARLRAEGLARKVYTDWV